MAGGDFPPVAAVLERVREADDQMSKKQKPEPEPEQPDAVEGTVEIRILEGPADLHGEMILVTIAPEGGAELFQQNVRFASKLIGYAAENMVCGNYKMQVKVTWSIMM
ncbi:hypothetical protein ZWY2020_001436 [Hordeum vulgare]|nr:hypothetical protein ZWY2020_001436 [Hordeum vulgare]